MYDIECPYCGAELRINNDGEDAYDDKAEHKQECRECGKTFNYTIQMQYIYEAFIVSCLDGGEHKFVKGVFSHLDSFTDKIIRYYYKECSICGKRIGLTDKEYKNN